MLLPWRISRFWSSVFWLCTCKGWNIPVELRPAWDTTCLWHAVLVCTGHQDCDYTCKQVPLGSGILSTVFKGVVLLCNREISSENTIAQWEWWELNHLCQTSRRLHSQHHVCSVIKTDSRSSFRCLLSFHVIREVSCGGSFLASTPNAELLFSFCKFSFKGT